MLKKNEVNKTKKILSVLENLILLEEILAGETIHPEGVSVKL